MAVPRHRIDENLNLVRATREEAYDHVLAYARRRFGRYRDLIILEDIVDSVFTDLEQGVRQLTPSKTPLESLFGMVNSKISHWRAGQMRHVNFGAAQGLTVSRSQVEEIDFHLLCGALKEICKGEPLILKMLFLWEKDPGLKPGDIAELLHKDIRKIYKANERLKKITSGLRKEWLFRCSKRSKKP